MRRQHTKWMVLALVLAGCKSDDEHDGGSVDATPTEVTVTDPYAPVRLQVELTESEFEGFGSFWWIPEDPSGVVMVFHGSNGGIHSITQLEWAAAYNELAKRNIGFVATISTDRVEKVWDHSLNGSSNADFPRLDRLRTHVVQESGWGPQTPMATLGFSNGGSMAQSVGVMGANAGWPVVAYSAHNIGGYLDVGVPGIWTSAENDATGASAERVADAKKDCVADGYECVLKKGVERPIEPLTMNRLPELTETKAQAAQGELIELGLIDSEGNRVPPIADLEDVLEQYEARSASPSASLVSTQIRVWWATHRFSAQHAAFEADWLLEHFDR